MRTNRQRYSSSKIKRLSRANLPYRLRPAGLEVVGTAFGEEAVELALETQPDLLLSDINLRHGLSGIDLAQRIQSLMDVPVVFLTATRMKKPQPGRRN